MNMTGPGLLLSNVTSVTNCYKSINFYFLGPMEIQFTSDTSTFDRGFKLRYDVIGKKSDVDCGETNLPLWPRFTLNLIYPI